MARRGRLRPTAGMRGRRSPSIPSSSTACPPPRPRTRMIAWLEERGSGKRNDQLQAARLAVLPPAILGRAVPDRLEQTASTRCYRRASCRCCRRNSRTSSPPAPASRRSRKRGRWVRFSDDRGARDQHHAAVGRLVLVLPALLRSAERRAIRRASRRPSEYWMGGEQTGRRRPLRRRHGARGAAPALRALLAQGALRSRLRVARPSRSSGSSTRA